MNNSEVKIGGFYTYSEFLEDIKNGSVRAFVDLKGEEIILFWKAIHSVNNLQNIWYKITDFKKDFEENLPKMIENNLHLHTIRLDLPSETCEFQTEYLHQTLQKRSFQSISIHYPYTSNFQKDDVELDNRQYFIELLLGCFDKTTISFLSLELISLNDRILKKLEKINSNVLDFSTCRVVNKFKFSIQSSKVNFKNIFSKQDEFIYKFLENFINLQDLDLSLYGHSLDFLKLKKYLNNRKLKKLSINQFDEYKNPDSLKDILNNVTDEFNIYGENSYSYQFPIFTYLKNNKVLKSFNCDLFENYTDVDKFLQSNQSINKLKLTMKAYRQYPGFEKQIEKLGNGILKNHSLEHLYLEIPLNDGFEYLYKGMIQHKNLKNIEFSNCLMNDQVCKLFGNYLNNNSSLTNMKICSYDLSMKGLKYILNGLMKHKSLKSLILRSISIEEGVYESFKELLISNQHLIELKFIECGLNGNVLQFISEGLLFNSSLTYLFVDLYKYLSKDIDDFERRLFYNQTLKNIDFGYLKISKESYLYSILKRNSSFIQVPKEFLKMIPHDIHFNFKTW